MLQKGHKINVGRTPWNKGIPMPEEQKKRMSLKLTGEKNPFFGKKHSKETKQKLSELAKNRTGEKASNYGNRGKLNPMFGRKASMSSRLKQSIALTGRKFSSEHKANISKKAKLRIGVLNNFYGKHHTIETCQRLVEKRKNRVIPFKDTKPERMMQIALSLNGIKYEKHKPIKIGKSWHQVDIFIEPNICIEVDGVYWHIFPERIVYDLKQTQDLTILGYHVIRIRDKDILKNANNCAETIINLIKELQTRIINT